MKKMMLVAMLALLLVPAVAMAQAPPGCSWEGDPAFRYGWNYLDGLPYNQPGVDFATIYAGASIARRVAPYNAHSSWTPPGCKLADTLCFHAVSKKGWALVGSPAIGSPVVLPGAGYLWYQDVTITAPCAVTVGMKDTVIAICAYTNVTGVCDPACGDCNPANVRPTDGLTYYSKDTLIITVVTSPPALGVFQDTLTLVERGQTQAYVPFTICNQDDCAPLTPFNYSITTTGRVPTTIPGSVVNVLGGTCEDVYAILNAGGAIACTYDTLRIIVWVGSPATYDTCVQVIHIVEPEPVPLFTVPVVTILVLALILAAAVFMRRRAAARA